jgi:serine/threonine protein kinase
MMMDVGQEFSHYRVVEHIGRGGMADVWSARDKQLNRTVAVKTVARDLSLDMNPIRMFEREARTIAGLEHPHILPIYDFGEYEGQLYIVMRYVSGGSLEDLLEEGPLDLDEVTRLARAVGHALEYAHVNKVIHLDLKPSNILLDSYRSPYLADFGLATILGPEGRAANPGSGTLLYMAPEQLTAEQLDHRADIFSFCILLFHMMTGQLPFDATMPLALKQLQHLSEMPDPRDLRPDLPEAVCDVLRQGTKMDASKRPASIMDVVQQFEGVVRGGTAAPAAAPVRINISQADLATAPIEDLISGPLDDLVTRRVDAADLITMPPGDDDNITQLAIDVSDLGLVSNTPEGRALREAEDIYKRARRAWARGQGRFVLGVTDFILINDYYVQAELNKLELDEAGTQMLLRGALEYDFDIDIWWEKLNDENRRWVTLHAVRSENAPARVRALHRLEDLPDADPPQIPKQVAQALQVERNKDAKLAALRVLEKRARPALVGAWS